jgi:haloalkane dehalogenase
MQLSQEIYPFTPQQVEVNGFKVSYLDEGPAEGELTVMVHGNPTWSIYYRHLAQGVAKRGGRALVIDHVGCGLSDKPSADRYPYTLSRRIDDLGAWLEAVGVGDRPFNLVVHDWGGAIGVGYASKPEVRGRLLRLAAFNTAAFHMPGDKRLPPTLKLGRDSKLGQLLIQGLNAFSGLATRWAVVNPMPKALRDAYTAPYNSWANRVATYRFVRDIPLEPGDASYEAISQTQAQLGAISHVPTLLGWGLKDFVFDATFLSVWRARFPHAEVYSYEDAGHYVLEDKAEELTPKVLDFLFRERPASP